MQVLRWAIWVTIAFVNLGWYATAATVVWDGGGDGMSWNDRFNWVGDAIPTASDDVDAASATVTLSGALVSVLRVEVKTVTVQSRPSLTVTAGAPTVNHL